MNNFICDRRESERSEKERERELSAGEYRRWVVSVKKNKKTVPLEQNRCGLNVLERALDYDDRSYDFDSLLSRYQLLRRWTAGRSVPAFFSPDLLSLKAQRACNFLYDTVMSKLYRRKTNSKVRATEKRPRLYT